MRNLRMGVDHVAPTLLEDFREKNMKYFFVLQ